LQKSPTKETYILQKRPILLRSKRREAVVAQRHLREREGDKEIQIQKERKRERERLRENERGSEREVRTVTARPPRKVLWGAYD